MRHLTTVRLDELIDFLHTRVITNKICSAMQSMILWGVKIFLSLFIIFRTNIRMRIIYLLPCLLLFVLHLDWSLITSVDKKISFSFYICEIVFHFSLLVKLKIFFSLVLFSLDIHHRSRKKLIGKKLNVDRQFFKDVLYVILLQEGVGQYQFLGNCHPFPPFPFISTSSQMKIFIYSTNPFLLQPPSLPAHRPFNK